MKTIVYPGSFDPLTNGHVDVIHRLSDSFDKVIVLLAYSTQKKFMFSTSERADLISKTFNDKKNIEVDIWEGLLVQYLKEKNLKFIGKGLRTVKDFEYEMDMAHMNSTLANTIETFFILTKPEFGFLSSTLVKEVATFGGDLDKLVPTHVKHALIDKLSHSSAT